ncbi:MAG: hypothetical protein QM765_21480 [Myxococcales bacterium]
MAETTPAATPSPAAPPPAAHPVAPVAPVHPVSTSPQAGPVLIRGLFINLLFAMFAATVVFAVASYYFLVPRIALQELHAARLERDLHALQVQVRELSAPAKPGPAPAPVQPAAPAAAPAAPASPSAK